MEEPAAVVLSCGLPLLAGLCIAAWAYADRPTELALGSGTLAVALPFSVVHTLGWTNTLTPGRVLWGTWLVSAVAIALTLALPAGRRHLRRALGSLGRFVGEALAAPVRHRSLVALAGLIVLSLSAWTAYLAYLAPSSSWDGVMYHEPMVGFALQNHGFREMDLASANRMLSPVDGYPRLMENLMLVLVAAWDRRLIELVPSLLFPLTLVASYAALRRFVDNRLAALGLAAGYVLIPGIALQLRSTYVDIGFATFVPAAIAFLCRRDLRGRDLWMGGVALGLVGAAKISGFIIAPLLGAVGVGLVVWASVSKRNGWLPLHLLGGLVLVLLLAAPTYWRNWTVHENPLYPGVIHLEALGIEWDGPLDIRDMNASGDRQLSWLFSPPLEDRQFHDTRDNGYGNVPPFLILPFALLGLLRAFGNLVTGRERWRAIVLLSVTLPLIATFAITPARHWARLNLHTVFALFLLTGWAMREARSRLLAEGVGGALLVGGLLTLGWSEPGWEVDRTRLTRLRAMPAADRALDVGVASTQMPTDTARMRESELIPGSLVVFDQAEFAGVLWNERFDNRVEYLNRRTYRGEAWLEEAERRGALWAVLHAGSPLLRFARQRARWQEVGPGEATGRPSLVFRLGEPSDQAEDPDAEMPDPEEGTDPAVDAGPSDAEDAGAADAGTPGADRGAARSGAESARIGGQPVLRPTLRLPARGAAAHR
ncbi:MAG: hypothetical protein AB8I08_04590 [Sandaracinaceae bacterium]